MPFIEQAGRKIVPVWIKGQAHTIDEQRLIEVHSAAQAKVIHHAQGASVDVARAAADSAWTAFESWKNSKYHVRQALLLKVTEIYEKRTDELTAVQVDETSCTEEYARFNIKLAIRVLRDFAGTIIEALSGELPPMLADGYALVFKQPVGTVLTIPPWNSAIILSTRAVSAAISAGCTVVLKASEACPRTHNMIIDIFEEAGLPKGCINQVQASRDDAAAVTEALISHKAIRKIEFIGSAAVGSKIGQLASKHLKPILLELGGKGPAIVLKDADLKQAASFCAFGAFLHHGQICFSTERIIVDQAIAPEFTKYLQDEIEQNWSSNPFKAAHKAGASHAQDLVKDALDNGATLVAGDGSFTDSSRLTLTPTIITNVSSEHKIFDQETFGPSASLYTVDGSEEAVKLANASAYGLSATIHTMDYMKALDMAKDLEYGQVHVNTTTVYDQSTLPVQGVKGSGWGSNNGKYGLEEFLERKTVTLHRPEEGLAFGN